MIGQDPRELEADGAEQGEDEGLDVEALKETLGFVLRSPRRRPRLAATTFVLVAAFGLTIAAALPRTYNAEVKLLAQRTSVIRALSSSNKDVGAADNPTKNVADMIMRHENLVALVKQADLVDRFYATRPPMLRFKDDVVAWMGGPRSEQDKLRGVVGTLEKRLTVTTDEATVVISVDWPEPQMAYELVTLVQKNFLEARYDSDVAVITDSIAVLQEHAKSEATQVDAAIEAYQRVSAEQAGKVALLRAPAPPVGAASRARPPATNSAVPSSLVDPELAKSLEEKRREIRAIESERQRQLDGLKQQLAQAQLTLTPMHPAVIAVQQKIDALAVPNPELARLKDEERGLMAQIAPTFSAPPSAPQPLGASPPAAGAPPGTAAPPPLPQSFFGEDGPTQLAHSKLEAAIRSYENAMERVDAANVELDITRTAFKYRYTVVTPAELPSGPKKAMGPLVGIASVLGAALLALLVAALADLAAGRVLESWQVRRRLKIEVLGELEMP